MATTQAVMAGPQGAVWRPEYDPGITDAWWQTLAAGIKHPQVVLHGGYGKHNLGDDAILEALVQQVKTHLPDARLTVLAHGPEFVRARYGLPAYHFASAGALRAIVAADLYVIGGGGIVNRINTYSGFQRWRLFDPKGKFLFLAAALARLAGARVIFHSIGVTSFPDPLVRMLTLATLSWADAVCVRDQFSAQLLRQAGLRRNVPVVYDPAVRLSPAPPHVARALLQAEGVNPDRPIMFINFRPVADPAIDNDHTAQMAAHLVEKCYNRQVVFFPFGRHPHKPVENDLAFLDKLKSYLGQRELLVIQKEYTPAEVKAMLGLAQVCVVERLHAAILAVSMGVPVVSIAYDDKAAAFMDMVGLADDTIPLAEFNVERVEQRLARWLK